VTREEGHIFGDMSWNVGQYILAAQCLGLPNYYLNAVVSMYAVAVFR
jgi:hypothetical protein